MIEKIDVDEAIVDLNNMFEEWCVGNVEVKEDLLTKPTNKDRRWLHNMIGRKTWTKKQQERVVQLYKHYLGEDIEVFVPELPRHRNFEIAEENETITISCGTDKVNIQKSHDGLWVFVCNNAFERPGIVGHDNYVSVHTTKEGVRARVKATHSEVHMTLRSDGERIKVVKGRGDLTVHDIEEVWE